MLRRTFLQATSGAALAAAATAPGDGIRLGFDTFSIRDFRWRDIQLLDYAASLKLPIGRFVIATMAAVLVAIGARRSAAFVAMLT